MKKMDSDVSGGSMISDDEVLHDGSDFDVSVNPPRLSLVANQPPVA